MRKHVWYKYKVLGMGGEVLRAGRIRSVNRDNVAEVFRLVEAVPTGSGRYAIMNPEPHVWQLRNKFGGELYLTMVIDAEPIPPLS